MHLLCQENKIYYVLLQGPIFHLSLLMILKQIQLEQIEWKDQNKHMVIGKVW